jgi:Domain of unknown function (DUF4177)
MQWEYETNWFQNFSELSSNLSGYGEQGWELVSAFMGRAETYICIFKRPKKLS